MTRHRLVTFLGHGDYDRRRYAFEDDPQGGEAEKWFLRALLDHLGRHPSEPDADVVTVIGTPDSSWYHLIEFRFGNRYLSDPVLDAVRRELKDLDLAVDRARIEQLAELLNRGAGAPRMDLRLIEQPLDPGGDQVVLHHIAGGLERGDRITLDVTHGFRHLPMLTLLAALYLRHVRRVKIVAILYAALDQREQAFDAPVQVVDLRRLVDLTDWIFALGRFDASGDAGAFVDVLERDGNPQAALQELRQGAALERATRTEAAAGALRRAQDRLDRTADGRLCLRSTGAFFAGELHEALAWTHAGSSFDQFRLLARRHLTHRDWPRAVVHMFEACCLGLLEQARPPDGRTLDRKKAVTNYFCDNPTCFTDLRAADQERFERRKERFRLLKDIRNALAHAVEAQTDQAAAIVDDPDRLCAELERLYDELLGRPNAFP